MPSKEKKTRREFIKHSTAVAAGVAVGMHPIGAPAIQKALGANNKITVGFIGLGNRGSQLLSGFMEQNDVQIAAFCDVYEPYMSRDRSKVDPKFIEEVQGSVPKMGEMFDHKIDHYKDFRDLLDRKDIDTVCIATPDHWHAVQTIMACQAGKDIYVEKPLTVTVVEGRKMVEAADRYKRIVQVGLHRRSSALYRQLAELVQGGKIGKVTVARAYRISNMYPDGIGKRPETTPPTDLDWDMWLGPRAKRPFKYNIAPYKLRWWQDYSSQVGNWGVHYFDAIRWVLGEEAPISISAHGGKYALDDDRTIPDTMEVIFEFASGRLLIFGQYEASGGSALESGEVEFRGTLGNIYPGAEANGYKIVPSRGGQFQPREAKMEAEEVKRIDGDLTVQHIRNFLDCVKTRKKTNCDLETGHRSTSFSHLANIAMETRARLEWDAKNEKFINNKTANKLLHYEYRKPWTLG
jgi:predicted dehydrogenase